MCAFMVRVIVDRGAPRRQESGERQPRPHPLGESEDERKDLPPMPLLPFSAALVCFALAVPAAAQEGAPSPGRGTSEQGYQEQKTSDGSAVIFKDDPLGATGIGPIGDHLTGFHPPKRFILMRPRVQFVHEMLKSVENM
jgi:hypothetical protein